MARSTLSTDDFAQLSQRLRHANARYSQIALHFQCSLRRTYHARRLANHVGLHVDIAGARACPNNTISIHPLPVIDRPDDGIDLPDASASAHATTENATSGGQPQEALHDSQKDEIPPVPLRKPEVIIRKRLCDGEPYIVLRLPPLRLVSKMDSPSGGQAEGSPELLPRQLSANDGDAKDAVNGSESRPSLAIQPSSLALFITIPPRTSKGKPQDTELEEASPQHPKRFLKVRWGKSQRR